MLRWCKYGAPDTWVGDTTDETAGFAEIGALDLPLIACGMSGQFTVLGKETEIYVLDGDKAATFYSSRQIGKAYGPCSTVGLAEITDAAVWMSRAGPAISVQGQKVELLPLDRVSRRILSYLNLETAWAAHDSKRHRVVWGLKRKEDDDGFAVDPNPFSPYLDELFWWDYLRHTFGGRPVAPMDLDRAGQRCGDRGAGPGQRHDGLGPRAAARGAHREHAAGGAYPVDAV